MGTSISEFNPYFQAAYAALNAHCGGGLGIGSGYRTTEEQAALLYKRAQGISVADPGTSRHEGNHGGAIDLEFRDAASKACAHENANAFGLDFGVPGEDWHLEFSAEGEAAAEDGTFAEKFGISADGEAMVEGEEPEPATLGDRWNRMVFGEQPEDVGEVIDEMKTKTTAAAGTEEASAPSTFTPEASAGFTASGGTMDPVEVARVLAQAGFKGDALVTALAVAFGESGLDSGAAGDTTITGGGWGPSLGLMQIRSHSEGGWRDASQLTDPVFNARAAYAISNGGTDFGPWTVWNEGIYKKYLDQAKKAVAQLGGETTFVPDQTRYRGLPAARDWEPDEEFLKAPIPDADSGLIAEMTEGMGGGLLNRLGFKRKANDGVPRDEEAA